MFATQKKQRWNEDGSSDRSGAAAGRRQRLPRDYKRPPLGYVPLPPAGQSTHG